jgi:GT2 family glycosyltransferase
VTGADVSAAPPSVGDLPGPIGLSVVIPTHDRPDSLRRCVEAVLAQDAQGFEIVIANDGTLAVPQDVRDDARVVVLDGPFGGPAAARNAAIAHAKGDLIGFTDDDTIPEPGWLRAAVEAMSTDRHVVGVVGQVECPPYDPVFEHAVQSHGLGDFLTCNALYRRWALESVGKFDEAFPYPHCEDRDLGYRLSRLGTIAYCPSMRVLHPARPVRLLDAVRRGRFVASEWRLHRKHPQSRPPRWSVRWGPVICHAQAWCRLASREAVFSGSPLRAVRFAGMAAGEVAVAAWTTLTGWSTERAIPISDWRSSDGLRVAYVGPCLSPIDGPGGSAWPVLKGLSELGAAPLQGRVSRQPEESPGAAAARS